MTAPIIVIELALMRSVYDNKNANIVIIAVSVVALGAFFRDSATGRHWR
jgi:hypothetical protein